MTMPSLNLNLNLWPQAANLPKTTSVIQIFASFTIINIIICTVIYILVRKEFKYFGNILETVCQNLSRSIDAPVTTEIDLNSRLAQLQKTKFSINMASKK